ncbi:BgTH12-02904 [Blumeria graminis f. sp. triticale]|uniref:BgTH12-02904 n=1 Tax=Blumeria graminis f. sp. triticale TaxID=1689686 RepID=A0A9W4D7B8_BLUGR|nr:BgTH12-02904 [Blumeria graminis f. sp. triticale]
MVFPGDPQPHEYRAEAMPHTDLPQTKFLFLGLIISIRYLVSTQS